MSRADFLASLGISNDDMTNPDDSGAPSPPSRKKSGTSGGSSSLLSQRVQSNPQFSSSSTSGSAVYSTHKPSPVKGGIAGAGMSGGSGYQSAILSMGADSDDDEEVYRAKPKSGTQRNATGSQEVSAAPGPVPPPRAIEGSSYSQASPSYESQQASFRSSTMNSSRGPNHNTSSASMSSEPGQASQASKMTRSEKAKEAESQKLAGNALFQDQEYRKAVRCYSKAIEMDPSNAALYSNRSAAYLAGRDQMGIDTRSMALRDAVRAVELRPDWAKGYCRQGEAFTELEQFEDAASAWTKALEYDPGNNNFKIRLAEAEDRAGPVKQSSSSINNHIAMNQGARRGSAGGSSQRSGSYNNPTGESARTLASQFYDQTNSVSGVDFKEQEMEKMRGRRSGNSFTSGGSSTTTSTSGAAPVGGVSGAGSSSYYSSSRSVPQEFSSGAARDYQNSLLEAYRKKKSGGK